MRQQRRAERLRVLLEHIREHHAERLSVEDAARLAGMRPSQMRKTFRRVTGMSLLQYLNQARLSRAARLLRETELTVAAVAMEVGFVDQSYFDRRFRREFGQTPSAFRAREAVGASAPADGAVPEEVTSPSGPGRSLIRARAARGPAARTRPSAGAPRRRPASTACRSRPPPRARRAVHQPRSTSARTSRL
ncbi:MAG: helix-turn-helix transcriptional regulator [Vicinamibacteria bacterium]